MESMRKSKTETSSTPLDENEKIELTASEDTHRS